MIFFKKHLNFAWLLGVLFYLIMAYLTGISGFIAYSIIGWVFYLAIAVWVLHRKGRSYAWMLIPVSVPFLINEKTYENPSQ